MGVLSWLKGDHRKAAPSSSNPPPAGYFGGGSSFSFLDIERNTTASACVNFYEHAISILPLNLYHRERDGSRRKAWDHPLYKVLKYRPNGSDSPTSFSAKVVRHVVEKGNAYLYKGRAGGQIVALRALNPELVREEYAGWTPTYLYQGERYSDEDVLHIPSLITDDYGHGKAPLELAKAAVRLGTEFDKAAEASFRSGIDRRLYIDLKDALKDCADFDSMQKVVRQYADYIARNYAGSDNAGKPLLGITGMAEPKALEGTSNKESELLESRRWQDAQICKAFGLPPWIVDGSYDVKYGGLEAGMIYVLNFSLLPYLRHFEQRFDALLDPVDRDWYYFEYDFSELLRTDAKSRAEVYSKLFAMGAIGSDEIDAKENLPPNPTGAGSARFVPSNMMPANPEVLNAYMAKAKAIAAGNLDAKTPPDPARAAGDQAQ